MPVALITGASRGIGRTSAYKFAEAGWDLLLTASKEDSISPLASELSKTGRKIRFKAIDLSNPSEISGGIKELVNDLSIPSVLVNNAGVAWTGELLSMPLESWQLMMQINLTSVFQICSTIVPLMRSNNGGLVINVSSHASRHAFPQWGAYCTSKAALASFTKCLAEEERANLIRACTVTLGSVNSSLWDSDTVHSGFDRQSMLSEKQAASAILYLAEQPSSQIIEDLTLMPASGAF